jgi:hypothetical protein
VKRPSRASPSSRGIACSHTYVSSATVPEGFDITSLRRLVECTVEVRMLDGPVHSDALGGPLTDAVSALAVMLATLYDERGDIAIPFETWEAADTSHRYPRSRVRANGRVRPGVRLLGTGTIIERLWMKPAVNVLGVDAPSVQDACAKLEPVAGARVSLRIPPGSGSDGRDRRARCSRRCQRALGCGGGRRIPVHGASPQHEIEAARASMRPCAHSKKRSATRPSR